MRRVEHAEDLRLAGYRDLVDDVGRSRADRDPETFVVEGARTILGLLEQGWPLRSVLLSANRAANRPDVVTAAETAGTEIYVAAGDLMDRVAGYHVHRGALALAVRPPLRPVGEVVAGVRLAVVTEGLNDLENLGSLFRNAAAFGAGAVLLDPATADPFYRRSVRVSLGHVTRIPFTRVQPWPAGLEQVRAAGLMLVALTPAGDETLDDLLAAPGGAGPGGAGPGGAGPGSCPGWAVMVGAEGPGLSDAALAVADHRVRIPMAGGVDSINVATAAAIALHRLSGSVTRP